jgi:hypothetical protein
MRIIIPHSKTPEQVKDLVDTRFDEIFTGLPVGPVEITDRKRSWNGSTLDFSFGAKTAFMTVPVSGKVTVEATQVTVDVEVPAFLRSFVPEDKVTSAVQTSVKALLN